MHAVWLTSLLAIPTWSDDGLQALQPKRVLIVVASQEYRQPLVPWVDRRRAQGFQIQFIDPASLANSRERSELARVLRQEIARRVQVADEPSGVRPDVNPAAFVLLVGDAPASGEPLDGQHLIPAAIGKEKSRASAPHRFVTDNVYGLPDERGVPRLAVGRWPVRTPGEVAVQVQKSLNYELGQSPGPHRRDITFLATTPNFDPTLDPVLERLAMGVINAQLKPHWGLRALYASPRSEFFPGPDQTARQVVLWLEGSTPITLFAGHGYDCGVDCVRYEGKEYTVLDSEVATLVDGNRPGTVLWISACSCGDFGLAPPRRGLAEALMMNPHGPTAVVAGSHETSAYANLLLCMGLSQDVIEQPPATLGEAFLFFKRAAFKPGPLLLKNMLLSMEPAEKPEFLPEDHQYLYNLLGDPTLALRLPRKVPFIAEVAEQPAEQPGQKCFRITGKLDGWESGTAWVSLMLDRMTAKEPVPDPATLENAAARRAAYADRFVKANDKTAVMGQIEVRHGCFELQVSVAERLAARVRWLQLYVCTDPTPEGDWRDGVGAQAVRLIAENVDREGTGR